MRYELVRSKRKTLALTIDRNGMLTARAPLRMSAAQIEAYILEKKDWIEKAQARMAMLPPPTKLTLADGSTLPYLGGTLTLRRASVARVTLADTALLVPMSATEISPVIHWLDTQARAMLSARVRELSQRLRLHPHTLRLSRAKGRWGSMSSRGTISLNHALILCPPDVVDYVIIHELCHIAQPDHSQAFWAKVELFLPDYRVKRDWLKQHNALITYLQG